MPPLLTTRSAFASVASHLPPRCLAQAIDALKTQEVAKFEAVISSTGGPNDVAVSPVLAPLAGPGRVVQVDVETMNAKTNVAEFAEVTEIADGHVLAEVCPESVLDAGGSALRDRSRRIRRPIPSWPVA